MNSEKRRGVRAARNAKASGGVVEELLGLRLQFEPTRPDTSCRVQSP